jgi:CRP-like cAMP-binding protein
MSSVFLIKDELDIECISPKKSSNNLINDLIKVYKDKPSQKEFSKSDFKMILKGLMELDYFKNISQKLGTKGMLKIAKALKIKNFQKDEIILNYGEEGREFYIILEGEVRVLIPDFHLRKKKIEKLIQVRELGVGSSFGDLALLRKKPRAATIIANTEHITLAEVDFNSYFQLLNEIELDRINRFIAFSRCYQIFNDIPKSYLERFYYLYEQRNYKKGQIIFREGDKLDGIYFIKSGEFLLSKKKIPKMNKIKDIENEIAYLKKENEFFSKCIKGLYNIYSPGIKNFARTGNFNGIVKEEGSKTIISLKKPEIFEV